MTTNYASLADLHTVLGVAITDTANDLAMQMALDAAASAIDRVTNRSFAAQDTNATTRYYSTVREHGEEVFLLPSMQFSYWYPYSGDWSWFWTTPERKVWVDDLFLTNQLITDIVVKDHTTQAVITLDRGWPLNASAKGKPYTALLFLSSQPMPRGEGQVDVTAKFGWPTVPTTIKAATILQAERYFKRKDAPFGVAGADAMGNSMRLLPGLDRDVDNMLNDYKRWWSAV